MALRQRDSYILSPILHKVYVLLENEKSIQSRNPPTRVRVSFFVRRSQIVERREDAMSKCNVPRCQGSICSNPMSNDGTNNLLVKHVCSVKSEAVSDDISALFQDLSKLINHQWLCFRSEAQVKRGLSEVRGQRSKLMETFEWRGDIIRCTWNKIQCSQDGIQQVRTVL